MWRYWPEILNENEKREFLSVVEMDNKKPPENITAEWTVHAQLTIKRPSDKPKDSSENVDSSSHTADDVPKQSNPVTIVYKWSSDDLKNESTNDKANFGRPTTVFRSDQKSDTNDKVRRITWSK